MTQSKQRLAASFRDPASYLFTQNNILYRQICEAGIQDYRHLMTSGLYDTLVDKGYLIRHHELTADNTASSGAGTIIRPDQLDFISYPYEWSFSQLKDAALLTLEIVQLSIESGMILKDASAFNIQFVNGKPLLIDTGSFQIYKEGEAWAAYLQFCKHFLAPLALMAKCDIRLGGLSRQFIDGVPLDLASRLLPKRSWFSYSLLANIHLHARTQDKYSDSGCSQKRKTTISRIRMLGLIDSLASAIKKLDWKPINTEWGDYYNNTNYSDSAATHKGQLISEFITKYQPESVWDLGGNNGHYSRLAGQHGANVVCWDIDPVAVEYNYRKAKKQGESILPLLQDLTNPTPNTGWAHQERQSLQNRGPVDLIMGLALIHHLAISNNVPLHDVAEYFSRLGKSLIIEFVPKQDSQVKRLLSSRKDIFPDYHIDSFMVAFSNYYEIVERIDIKDTCRTLFYMKRLSTGNTND